MINIPIPSKILLFGEYTVLLGSKALSVPNLQYNGSLEIFDIYQSDVGTKIKESNSVLKQFYAYLKENVKESSFPEGFNLIAFEDDIKSGLYFRSNIPEGSGLGSSGALVAAVYQKYAQKIFNVDTGNIIEIRKQLAFMESYFHQASSGIDPLVSLLQLPLLFVDGNIMVVDDNGILNYLEIFSLVDSKIQRNTMNLMEIFKQKMKDNTFEKAVYTTLIPSVNNCIDAYLQGDRIQLTEQLLTLSRFQLEYMKWLIPAPIQQQWKEGLETGKYYKLCGAGGGGFFLRYQ